ncbi:MAG: succinate dehydrogenase [Alphaproteobacteria bacterium]|nr:succinate dehydrogenase [Alphaproteobacteria bacterium]
MEFRLYLLQRLTALVMAPLVIGHIAVMIYAVQGGLSAAEILGRTQGSLFWGAFYGLFVLAAAIHAAIGLRTIVQEWLRLEGAALHALTCLVLFGLLALGGRAVYAVVAA